MTTGLVLQVVVSGLAAGAVYGLVAIGFTLVYRLTSVLQFAHGDLVGAASFVAVAVVSERATGVGGGAYAVAVAAALTLGALAGAAMYVLAIRPFLRRAHTLGWIGATAAVAFAIQGGLAALFPREGYVVPDALPFARWAPLSLPDGATLPPKTLWILGAGIALALAATAFLRRSRTGLALEAIASEPLGARAAGLPVERLVAGAFALAGLLAGAAAVLGTPDAATVATGTGVVLGLKGIAASVLGGLRSPARAFAAALGIGVLEAAVASLHVPGAPSLALGPAWRDLVPLFAVLAFLVVRSGRAREAPE